MRIFWAVLVAATLSASCGNPTIKRFLIRMPGSVYELQPKKPAAEVKKGKKAKEKRDVLTESMLIYKDSQIVVELESIEIEELDELAEQLGLYSTQRYYRLPGLTFLRYRVKLPGDEPVKLNLFKTYFEDEFGKKYSPISYTQYKDFYTSTSYNRFDYDFIYSFYLTEKDGEKSGGEEFYVSKVLPGKTIKLDATSKGFQIIPYRLFSPGSRTYTLHMWLYGNKKEISIPFYYRAIRSDEEEDVLTP